ncbi:MAG: amino acid transporter [Verrucomicrobia bacterium]|nr:amino acid transporter [Verrucomicrobiota bacterium]MBS0636359.1 amino acid transporter [Verrucomicrobiota bacterium]
MYSPRTLSAIFLVAGTCVGGGMLALPVATALNGFIPSISIMVLAWLAMMLTALYLVEVGFWMKKDDAHVISMTKRFMGPAGQTVAWLLYLFICYASLIAYTAGSGHLLTKAVTTYAGFELTKEMGCIIFIAIFGPCLFFSHAFLGRVNSILFIAMIVAYIALITLCVPHISCDNLMRSNWSGAWLAVPLLLTAFSFQTMVPSLHPYLNHHGPSLRLAIVGGTALAFLVYVIWQASVLGAVPLTGDFGLIQALKEGEAATHVLGHAVGSIHIELLASFFAFFALVTSFFGISLGFYDFLSDGLNIPKKGWGNILLGALILLPTLYAAINFEKIFLKALDASGGFGDSILNGLIPIAMIWLGRYHYKLEQAGFVAPKARWLLAAALLFYLGALGIEVLTHTGHFTAVHDLKEFDFYE